MNIETIKKELEKEVSRGEYKNFKEMYNFIIRLYRFIHKEDVKRYNKIYLNKLKSNKIYLNKNKEKQDISYKDINKKTTKKGLDIF